MMDGEAYLEPKRISVRLITSTVYAYGSTQEVQKGIE
jgi:hypothetical protein